MKNLKTFLAIAMLSLFLASCTSQRNYSTVNSVGEKAQRDRQVDNHRFGK